MLVLKPRMLPQYRRLLDEVQAQRVKEMAELLNKWGPPLANPFQMSQEIGFDPPQREGTLFGNFMNMQGWWSTGEPPRTRSS